MIGKGSWFELVRPILQVVEGVHSDTAGAQHSAHQALCTHSCQLSPSLFGKRFYIQEQGLNRAVTSFVQKLEAGYCALGWGKISKIHVADDW